MNEKMKFVRQNAPCYLYEEKLIKERCRALLDAGRTGSIALKQDLAAVSGRLLYKFSKKSALREHHGVAHHACALFKHGKQIGHG